MDGMVAVVVVVASGVLRRRGGKPNLLPKIERFLPTIESRICRTLGGKCTERVRQGSKYSIFRRIVSRFQ